ncbi:S8 family serine peptidase [Nonomuraea sp. NPDC046802]|uniref:S8 family peptidase n=1 Tax=Nonomuraea sp. NPDC046802 TaxID=3154919 RepID=UPI0033D966C3
MLRVLGRRGRVRRGTVMAASVAVTASLLSAPGAHASAAPPPITFTGGDTAHDEITLITGDRVRVRDVDDEHQTVTVTPAPRADGSVPTFQVRESDDGTTVIPDDVAALVPGRLDGALFNVTALAEQGDDASIPLILTYEANATKAAIPAVKQERALESIGGVGASVAAADAAAFGAELAKLASSSPQARAAGPLAGVSKIWLDRKVKSALEQSVPQIGAPEAWAAGFDGTGTTVAVLDTGVDATHPELAGKVADRRDFTDEDTAGDPNGHGTHVAGTIAGSGSADGGKGVAPGAKLLDGRVLNADGFGSESGIIDAMEWAAGEKRAEVVNMSLGAPYSGGPLTTAVGELTRQYGTLFVVAAGNRACERCVFAPGDAPEALTVGAVDKQDALADFSSKGPVAGMAVKPDVTAPGVDIKAARSGGGHLVASGTSMAAPHVAGATALLRQARPGVSGGEVKSLLMGTARPGRDIPVDHQGTGRIDVPGALKAEVVASAGSVDFGRLYRGEEKSLTVTYRNLGSSPAELALSSGAAFTVEPARLTVPASGTAEAKVTIKAGEPSLLRQELTAVAGGGSVRTLLTANVDVRRVELRVRGFARDGRAARGRFIVHNLDEGTQVERALPGEPAQECSEEKYGTGTCLLVKPGTYSVLGHIVTMPATQDSTADGTPLNTSLVGNPELKITGNTELVLDARKAVEVKVETPDHETKRNSGAASALMWYRAGERGPALRESMMFFNGAQIEERLFVQPTRKVSTGTFTAATRWRLTAPEITLSTLGLNLEPQYVEPPDFSDFSTEFPRLDGTRLLTAVDAGRGSPQEIGARDMRGKLAVIRRTPGVAVSAQSNAAAAAGAAMVAVYSDRPGSDISSGGTGVKLKVPTVRLSHEEGLKLVERLRRLPVPIVAKGIVASPYVYDLYLREKGRVRDSLTYVVRARSQARIETGYHSQLADDVTVNEARYVFEPWDTSSISFYHAMAKTPRTRIDYVTPDPDLRWTASASTPERPYNTQWPHPETPRIDMASPEFRPYEAGERVEGTMFKQPLLPGVNPSRPVSRSGDVLSVAMEGFVDADGNFSSAHTSDFERGLKTDLRLYQGDTLLWQTNYQASGSGTVTPDKSDFRIEYSLTNEAEWAKMSTRTKSVWTFSSEHTEEPTALPLLMAAFDTPADLRNQAGSRKLGLSLSHQQGARQNAIGNLSLELSYDDGATWKQARLRDKGGRSYETTLDRSPSGFVSLRLKAADVKGNSLTQEVIRAYAVR